ncbi:hypothetical protein BDZ89DRAFT_1160816 [Hymenopellis radicata]|nr:hypothetical protein BDZ89DRAFT_1160816 [Hymenopellis radicata]
MASLDAGAPPAPVQLGYYILHHQYVRPPRTRPPIIRKAMITLPERGGFDRDASSCEEREDFAQLPVLLDGRGDDLPDAAKDDSGSEDGDLDVLTSFVSSFPTAPKHKLDEPAAPKPKQQPFLKEQPAGPENPFAASFSRINPPQIQIHYHHLRSTLAPCHREAAYTATKAEVETVMRRVQA